MNDYQQAQIPCNYVDVRIGNLEDIPRQSSIKVVYQTPRWTAYGNFTTIQIIALQLVKVTVTFSENPESNLIHGLLKLWKEFLYNMNYSPISQMNCTKVAIKQ